MGKKILGQFIIFLLSNLVIAQYGVKNNYRQNSENDNTATFPANENGTCYKRVPYDQVLSLNTTGHIKLAVGSYQGVKQDSRVWVTIIDCCDGYQPNPTTGQCESHCDEGCIGGTCTDGICTCEPGWSAENGVCKPQCRFPCQRDAYCFSPDVCQCKLGYEKDAYDQCKPVCPGNCTYGECIAPRVCKCRSGYMLNERQECIPVCEGGCLNGDCTAPGICTCFPGYSNPPGDRESCIESSVGNAPNYRPDSYNRDSYNTQRPEVVNRYSQYCQSGCPNGRCVGPNQCVCNPGYSLDPTTQECISSYTPTKTTSNPSQVSQNTSQFHCSTGCPNGRCVAPNICICNDGFVIDRRTQTCVDYWSANTTPDTRTTISDPNANFDSPQCRNGCRYGRCIGRDQCICNPGYRMDPRLQACVPHYQGNTRNDNVYPGRSESDNQRGTPETDSRYYTKRPEADNQRENPETDSRYYTKRPETENQRGTPETDSRYYTKRPEADNQRGTPETDSRYYTKTPSYNQPSYRPTYQQTTTPSYEVNKYYPNLNNFPGEEVSQCPDGCRNGQCVGPYQCNCNPGYTMDYRTQKCVADQTQISTTEPPSSCRNCRYGQCISGQCICNPGYRMDPTTQTCRPHYGGNRNPPTDSQRGQSQCSDGCLNGQCVGPNRCICNPGYQQDPRTQKCIYSGETSTNVYQVESNYRQSSQCPNGCQYGQCLGPNNCVCNEGYRMDPRTQTCRPYSSSSSTTRTQPSSGSRYDLSHSCPNGYRMDERSRNCVPDYETDSRSHQQTTPDPQSRDTYSQSSQCRDGCRNGRCIGPNQCVCNRGYVMNPHSQTCIPTRNDESWGVENSNSNQMNTASQCRDGCPNGQCTGPDHCVCNPGYTVHPLTNKCISMNNNYNYSSNENTGHDPGNSRYPSEPSCDRPCLNGECTGYNQCTCNRGYSNDLQDQYKCLPVCRGGCANGVCTAPNLCLCNPGYIKDRSVKGSQRCIPNQ